MHYFAGYCGIYYECDNKRCIHKTITCNDYNSCGDYSDCQTTLEAGAIAGIVVGSVFGLILIVSALVSFFCCLRPKKSSPGQTVSRRPTTCTPRNEHRHTSSKSLWQWYFSAIITCTIFPSEGTIFQGPVVHSIVSLTSSLVIKMLSVLLSTIAKSQVFLLKRYE